jgi:hypothetical protein
MVQLMLFVLKLRIIWFSLGSHNSKKISMESYICMCKKTGGCTSHMSPMQMAYSRACGSVDVDCLKSIISNLDHILLFACHHSVFETEMSIYIFWKNSMHLLHFTIKIAVKYLSTTQYMQSSTRNKYESTSTLTNLYHILPTYKHFPLAYHSIPIFLLPSLLVHVYIQQQPITSSKEYRRRMTECSPTAAMRCLE